LTVPPEQIAQAEVRFWEQAEAQPYRRQWLTMPRWNWVAAACVSLIALAGALWWYDQQPVTISTAFGETRTIRLPDGSHVTLNAHSTLSYPRHWDSGQARQVWLQGEAFFWVSHTATLLNQRQRIAGECTGRFAPSFFF